IRNCGAPDIGWVSGKCWSMACSGSLRPFMVPASQPGGTNMAGFGRSLRASVAGALLAVVAGAPAVGQGVSPGQQAGLYMERLADCMACHTQPGGTPFAGGREIGTPYGSLSSPNITPDKDTGIGGW